MGLDATVFRNKAHIELGRDAVHAKLDPHTGEVYFDDVKLSRKHYHKRQAVSHRLGNITAIAMLREEIPDLLPPDSLIAQEVIYSGSHCGDLIPLDKLPQLSAQLLGIRQSGKWSPLMLFVAAMEELVEAAKKESNPIVF